VEYRLARTDEDQAMTPADRTDDGLGAVAPLQDVPSVDARISEALRELIVSHGLAPGTKLPLRDLAARFEVSVTPVRLALRDLVNDGLVETNSSGTMQVAATSAEEFEEVWSTRTGVEPWLARRGAERLSDTAFQDIDRLFDHVRRAALDHRRDLYVDAVWRYRKRCYEEANRPRILELALGLYARSRRYNHLTLATTDRIDRAYAYMEQFHEACRARDGRRAQQTMREALDWTTDYVLEEFGVEAPGPTTT
jgi:DNA-binding GntR family transcriptional regulator